MCGTTREVCVGGDLFQKTKQLHLWNVALLAVTRSGPGWLSLVLEARDHQHSHTEQTAENRHVAPRLLQVERREGSGCGTPLMGPCLERAQWEGNNSSIISALPGRCLHTKPPMVGYTWEPRTTPPNKIAAGTPGGRLSLPRLPGRTG